MKRPQGLQVSGRGIGKGKFSTLNRRNMTCSFPRTESPDIFRTWTELPLLRTPAPSVATADPACGHFSGHKNIYGDRLQHLFLATGKVEVFEAGKIGIFANNLFLGEDF